MGKYENLERQHQTLKKVHMSVNVRVETLEAEVLELRKKNTELISQARLLTDEKQRHDQLMNQELQASEARVAEQRKGRVELAQELKELKDDNKLEQ